MSKARTLLESLEKVYTIIAYRIYRPYQGRFKGSSETSGVVWGDGLKRAPTFREKGGIITDFRGTNIF